MFLKIINLVKSNQYHLFLAICIGLISFVSFNLGKINSLEKLPLKIGESGEFKMETGNLKADVFSAVNDSQSSLPANSKKLDTRVVVSKASTSKKYHHSWCASAGKIKPENQVWFNSDKEAETAGYTLAGNCNK